MTKNMYIQPSVTVTEMLMVQALCVSGSTSSTFSTLDVDKTTPIQL